MKILTVPSKILYRKARPVEVFGPHLQALIDKMFITMYRHKGVGLAANQVGVLKQIIVLNMRYCPMVLINPHIRFMDSGQVSMTESCLSVPNYFGLIKRQERISVVSRNRYGEEQNFEANGLLARCVQHEIEHLQGILITDHE